MQEFTFTIGKVYCSPNPGVTQAEAKDSVVAFDSEEKKYFGLKASATS